MSRQVLLNQLPPIWYWDPDVAYPALLGHLASQGIRARALYWNVRVAPAFEDLFSVIPGLRDRLLSSSEASGTLFFLGPFLYAHLDRSTAADDERRKRTLVARWTSMLGSRAAVAPDVGLHLLQQLHEVWEDVVEDGLAEIDPADVSLWGLQFKRHQWIPGVLFSEKLRALAPRAVVTVGGFDSEPQARAAMELWPHIDLAVWGEGEHALAELHRRIESGLSPAEEEIAEGIPRLLYRREGAVVASPPRPPPARIALASDAYGDFFEALADADLDTGPFFSSSGQGRLSYAMTRGCDWRRCRFCTLHQGYQPRAKPPGQVLSEVLHLHREHQVARIQFAGQDLFCGDRARLLETLDLLIDARLRGDLSVSFAADVATHHVTPEICERLRLAGFDEILIGYEAQTDRLLAKMGKRHRLATNLAALKAGVRAGLQVNANVLAGLPEETEDDVLESIENARLLRFLLGGDGVRLWVSPFRLSAGAPAAEGLSPADRAAYSLETPYTSFFLLPSAYALDDIRFELDAFSRHSPHEPLWIVFRELLDAYRTLRLRHRAFEVGDKLIVREFVGQQVLREHVLDETERWILAQTDARVLGAKELQSRRPECDPAQLAAAIDRLRAQALLCTAPGREQIISLVDYPPRG